MTKPPKLPATIRAADVARITGYDERWLRTLAKEGWFPAPKLAVYKFEPLFTGISKYFRQRDSERVDVAGLEAQKLAKEIEVLDETLTSKKRKNAEESRDLVGVASVNAAQLSTDNIVRQKILELGNRFESRYVPGMATAAFRKMIDESTDEILTELSKALDLFAKGGDAEEEEEE